MNKLEILEEKNPLNTTRTYRYWIEYDRAEVDEFLANTPMYSSPITKFETLYISKEAVVSQSKLREAGFTITRNPQKADIIVIHTPLDDLYRYNSSSTEYKFTNSKSTFKDFNEFVVNNQNQKFIWDTELYKHLYKYEGNLELATNIVELLKSNDPSNVKMAMEFMANADWTVNEIYLQYIFHKYWDYMRSNDYAKSISFSGFINSLSFNHAGLYLVEARHYTTLCKTEEHHTWVFNLFRERFEEDLKQLFGAYKIKLNTIDYEISKEYFNEE